MVTRSHPRLLLRGEESLHLAHSRFDGRQLVLEIAQLLFTLLDNLGGCLLHELGRVEAAG